MRKNTIADKDTFVKVLSLFVFNTFTSLRNEFYVNIKGGEVNVRK